MMSEKMVDRARFELATYQVSAVHYTYIPLLGLFESKHSSVQ